jgi:benzaldehyde dehydrogenase (NAD)
MALLSPAETWSGQVFTGQWVASSGETAKSVEPATGEVLGVVGTATADDVAKSAEAAAKAGRKWAKRPYQERAEVLRRAAQLLEDNADEVANWIAREAGKVAAARSLELQLTIDELWQAAALTAAPTGALLPTTQADRLSIARRQPHGVVAVIAPWNFPLNLAMRSVAPALACGNAVILKPASETAVCCGVVIARLFQEAGLPEGVLHMLPGKGSELGTAFADDPNIDMISFTGSTEVGKQLSEAAGRNIKKFVAELGGNNPFLVLDDVDVRKAAQAAAFGCFTHQGQICMATGRVLVAEAIADEFVEELVAIAEKMTIGNPLDDVDLGPIINECQADHIEDIVKRSIDDGAQLRAGGKRDGLFYRPTVLTDVSPDLPASREEIFGPVAAITRFSTDEEAIRLANDSPYGLVAAVHSGSVQRARAVGDQLFAGMVHINDQTVNDEVVAPFGGRGDSGGDGRFGSFTNLDEFTTWQWITVHEKQSTGQ